MSRDRSKLGARSAMIAGALLAALVSGCVGEPAATLEPGNLTLEAAAIMERTECRGINAFGTVDDAVLRPHVPENWTFTTGSPGRGIVRIFAMLCPDSSTVFVATPMVPDAASAVHHDNPDHVIEVFATDADEVRRWEAAGVPAHLSEISQVFAAPFDELLVMNGSDPVLDLDLLPASVPRNTGYEFQAVYSAGTGEQIAWFWGDEVSPSLETTRFLVTFGSGSRLANVEVQTNFAQEWASFGIVYQPGLPP